MPELPEVETLSRQLNLVLPSQIIKKVIIKRTKNFIGEPNSLLGAKIISVSRFAKVILIQLSKPKNLIFEQSREVKSLSKINYPLIAVHLKMTGQLIFDNGKERVAGGHPTKDFFDSLPNKYTRAIIEFENSSHLFFNDQRTFGWLKIIKSEDQFKKDFKNLSGIEPFSPQFTWTNLKKNLGKSTRPIKLSILDQSKIVGIGNIYANDGLFLTRLSPTRKTNSLTDKQWQKLIKSLKQILKKSIKLGGTSQANYLHIDGSKGNYQDHFLVYRKEGQPCPICQKQIKRLKLGGRSTFYCSHCQK